MSGKIFNLTPVIAVLMMLACFFPFVGKHVVNSPEGSVAHGTKIYSLDGKYYIQEVEPYDEGIVAVYEIETNAELNRWEIKDGYNNIIKGMAWDVQSNMFAIMYHKDNYTEVSVYIIKHSESIGHVTVLGWCHYMSISCDLRHIYFSYNLASISYDIYELPIIFRRPIDFV